MSQISIISGPGLDGARVGGEARNINDPNQPITFAQLAALYDGAIGPQQTVTPRSSMKVTTVWACVQVISRAMARMPLLVYERTDGGRERAIDHPTYELLKLRPNAEMSSYMARQAIIANALLWGNGYAEIVRTGGGRITELVPIESDRVTPFRVNGELRYRVSMPAGGDVTLLMRDMVHLPGLSFNGVTGLSVIGHARTVLASSMSRDQFNERFIGNGCRPSGVVSHPGKLKDGAIANLRSSLEAMYAGPDKAGRIMVLEEGMTWAGSTMPLTDAQWVETYYASVEDICRWFGVPPHKVQHLARATNNNIEQQSLDFLGDTVAPWAEALEQELNWKLFTPEERTRYYVEHLTQVLVQMDADARGQLYQRLFQIGAISQDEIRERENLNSIPERRGAVFYVPSNLMPAMTPDQANRLGEAWISKGGGGGGKTGGQPDPQTNDKVAQAG